MRFLAPLLLMLLPTAAWAQTSAQTGLWLDATPGLGLGGRPFAATPGLRAGLGAWWGNYDESMALGRSWGVGVAIRGDLRDGDQRLAPSIELRRTVDLLVIGTRWRVLAGPEWEGDALGVGARLGGSLKVRPSPWIGPTLDVEAGAAWVDGGISPRFAFGLGVEGVLRLSDRRNRRTTEPEAP